MIQLRRRTSIHRVRTRIASLEISPEKSRHQECSLTGFATKQLEMGSRRANMLSLPEKRLPYGYPFKIFSWSIIARIVSCSKVGHSCFMIDVTNNMKRQPCRKFACFTGSRPPNMHSCHMRARAKCAHEDFDVLVVSGMG